MEQGCDEENDYISHRERKKKEESFMHIVDVSDYQFTHKLVSVFHTRKASEEDHPLRYPTFSIKAWISALLLPSVASTILGLSNEMTSERG